MSTAPHLIIPTGWPRTHPARVLADAIATDDATAITYVWAGMAPSARNRMVALNPAVLADRDRFPTR